MEAPEVPLEGVQEHINHHAEHSPEKKWVMGVALSAAIYAAFAAVASLLAGHHANEALISQIKANDQVVKASDQWAYYQAKGIKAAVINSKIDVLRGLDKAVNPKDEAKAQGYEKDQEEIKQTAEKLEHSAEELKEEGERHLGWHLILARSVTMFQVSIAVAAVAVLVSRKPFWYVSLVFGLVGVFFLIQELATEFLKH